MNSHEQHITNTELSESGRELLEKTIAQIRSVFHAYKAGTTKDFINARPDQKDIEYIVTLFKLIKDLNTQKTNIEKLENQQRSALAQHIGADRISEFHEGYTVAQKGNQSDRQQWHIDKTGKPLYDQSYNTANPFSDGVAKVSNGYINKPDFEQSLINTKGEIIIGPSPDIIIEHSALPHLVTVQLKKLTDEEIKQGKERDVYLMNKKGETLAGPYKGIRQFDYDTLTAWAPKGPKEIYLLNQHGEEVAGPFVRESQFTTHHETGEPIAICQKPDGEFIHITPDGKEWQ